MKKFLFLGITMLMLVLTACNKESEQNIVGSWKLVLIQESNESNDYDWDFSNESESYALEDDYYYDFQKDGVVTFYDKDGNDGSCKWVYVDGKIIIDETTYNIENFSHKEMDLVISNYDEYYDEDEDYTYWYRDTYRMHFKREKTPKEYRNK